MELMQLKGAGLFAWSNSKKNNSLFATTTVYDSFSQDPNEVGTLEIFSFDLMSRGSNQRVAKIEAQFTALDWEAFGEKEKYPYGIIASGFSDGNIALWDVNPIISSRSGENDPDVFNKGLLCLQAVHSTPVSCLSFNPFKQHLIASGGSEVVIHNIEQNIADPDIFSPGENLHENSPINDISWNRKVPHILASASSNGISVIWDLKMNKAIFSFNDNKKFKTNRKLSLSWNPEIPTQIGVVYDDETSPELQIWDLRNPQGPVFASEKVHSKGIHSMDWCLTDSSLIATLGRDNKVCFWNYKSAENNLVDEKGISELGNKIKWSPRLPGIYSVTNKTSTTVYSMNEQTQIDPTNVSAYAPKWLKPPVGARFSFDGKLAVFSEKDGSIIKQYQIVQADTRVEPLLSDFEKNFLSTKIDINQLCDNRINSQFTDPQDKEEWRFIKAVSKNDPDEIIAALGLEKEKIIKKTEKYTGKSHHSDNTKKKKPDLGYDTISEDAAFSFFDNLANNNKPSIIQDDDTQVDSRFIKQETVQKNTNWDAGIEKYIKDNILIGNIEGAVDAALKNGRTAEAILIAYSRGAEYFKSTVKQYFVSCNESFIKTVIRGLIEGVGDLVKNHDLENWKECVALGLNYADPKSFPAYMEQLANRLISEKEDYESALLCFILSRNYGKILENYAYKTENLIKGSIEHTNFILRTVEKLTAMRIISGQLETNPILDRFIYEISKPLHTTGRDSVLLNLMTINDCRSFDCLVIRDRIINSNPDLSGLYPNKSFPFRQENVGVKTRKQETQSARGQLQNQPNLPKGNNNPNQKIPQQEVEKPIPKPIFTPGGNKSLPNKTELPPSGPYGNKPSTPFTPQTDKTITGPPINKPFTPGPNIQQREEEKETKPPVKSNIPPPKRDTGPVRSFNNPPVNDTTKSTDLNKQDITPPPIKSGGFKPTQSVSNTSGGFGSNNNPLESFGGNQGSFGGNQGGFGGNQGGFGGNQGGFGGNQGGFGGNQGGFGGNQGNTTSPFENKVQNTSSTSSTLSNPNVNKFQPPPTNKPMFPKPNIPSTIPSTTNTSTQPSNTFTPNQNVNTQQNNLVSPPPTNNFNKPGPGVLRPPPTNNKPIPKPGMSSGPSTTTTTTTSSTQLLTEADLPPNCGEIYGTVMTGIDLLDQIDKNPKKRIENEQKMNALFNILANGTMKDGTFKLLAKLCEDLIAGNFDSARAIQEKIAKDDWDANKEWLNCMRRIILRK